MRPTWNLVSGLLLLQSSLSTGLNGLGDLYQHALQSDGGGAPPSPQSVSVPFFADLERLARLVDITYCVGTTGISPPFSCASRCKEFPSLQLASIWNTGVLMSDSCGYIAVDHGEGRINDGGQGGAIIVAFRGTYSITNTVVDLSTVPQEYVPYPEPDDDDEDKDKDGQGASVLGADEYKHKCDNCTVHMGFLASWRQARKLVLPVLKSVREKHPNYPMYLVGHSLGGAVAALASLELKVSLGWDDLIVTTFGEPRTGNKGFVRYLDKIFDLENDDGYDVDLEKRTYRRVTHVDDPVPLLPLTEWGYRSHAGEVYINKPSLSPAPEDLRMCRGDNDEKCMAGAESTTDYGGLLRKILRMEDAASEADDSTGQAAGFPTHLKPWELFFAHRDYFWRLGLCLPGGDPADWGRDRYNLTIPPSDEL